MKDTMWKMQVRESLHLTSYHKASFWGRWPFTIQRCSRVHFPPCIPIWLSHTTTTNRITFALGSLASSIATTFHYTNNCRHHRLIVPTSSIRHLFLLIYTVDNRHLKPMVPWSRNCSTTITPSTLLEVQIWGKIWNQERVDDGKIDLYHRWPF